MAPSHCRSPVVPRLVWDARSIDAKRPRPRLCKLPRARPRPVRRRGTKSASNRVQMDVPNLFPDLVGRKQIAVVSAAALPEPDHDLAVRRAIRHLRQVPRRITLDPRDPALRHRLLHRRQDGAHLRGLLIPWARPNQQMHMFRHRHPCPQVKLVRFLRKSNRINQPLPRAINRKKRPSLKTREREVASVPVAVEPLESAPIPRLFPWSVNHLHQTTKSSVQGCHGHAALGVAMGLTSIIPIPHSHDLRAGRGHAPLRSNRTPRGGEYER